MIAKRILRGKAGRFAKLGAYIARHTGTAPKSQRALALVDAVAATAAGDAAIWQRTADYIIDAVGGRTRATAVRISNCHATDIDLAIAEIEATQALNVRARGDRTYHLVVSFPPGERPSPERLINIEDELCRAIGLQAHQRISAVHNDTAHLHMHIAINQVHPQSHACIEPWYDKKKLMTACARLEIKHGLQRTHGAEAIAAEAPPRLPEGAEALERHGGVASFAGWVREQARPALLAALEHGQSWQDLHTALAAHGLTIRPRGAGLIIADNGGRATMKASSVDRALSKAALEARWGAFAPAEPAIKSNPAKSYRKGPMQKGGEVEALYDEYRKQREAALAERAKVEAEIGARRAATSRWHDQRRKLIRDAVHLSAKGKEYEFASLTGEAGIEAARDDRFAREARAKARADNPLPSWRDFLRQAASQGHGAALAALRRQDPDRLLPQGEVLPGAKR